MIRKEDTDPVWYCRRCLSLCIKLEDGQDYCGDCGSTDIGELPDIYEWEKIYIRRNGSPYVNHPSAIIMQSKL